MLSIGDKVLYGAQGVCVFEGEETKVIANKSHTYLVLSPVFQSSNKIFIPKDNDTLISKLKKILTSAEAETLISNINSAKGEWIEDDAARRESFKEILASADRMALADMLKSLYKQTALKKKEGKKLHISDEQFFTRAKNLLHTEIGVALGLSADEAEKYIKERINI